MSKIEKVCSETTLRWLFHKAGKESGVVQINHGVASQVLTLSKDQKYLVQVTLLPENE